MSLIPVAQPLLGTEEYENVVNALRSGWISSKGEFIDKFEMKFAEFCGASHGIATSNGTTALHLALVCLGIKRNDEVIVPDLTFAATANAVKYCGAKLKLIDSNPDYWCIDPGKIEERITKSTRAIIPVHLYGHPCDMDSIMDIADDRDLLVIEDCAEAHGAECRGKRVGSFGDISCFSFYGNKTITTGEGGMCLTSNEELAEKMRLLRNHGMNPRKRYWHDVVGYNYRMTNIQAAIGVAQIGRIEAILEKKRRIASSYQRELQDLIETGWITPHPEMRWAVCTYWLYSILVNDASGMRRDLLSERLWSLGIETRPFFFPLHALPPYRQKGDFEVSDSISRRGLNLPSGAGLSTEQIRSVVSAIR